MGHNYCIFEQWVHKPNHQKESAEYNLSYLKYTKVQIFYETKSLLIISRLVVTLPSLYPAKAILVLLGD
jgi:hypothetical protein